MPSASARATAPVAPERRLTAPATDGTAFGVLLTVSAAHLLNDTLQSLLPAVYPLLKDAYALSFSQIGFMTLALMLTASLLQPVVGYLTDRRPAPFALVVGMGCSLAGLLLLAFAQSYAVLLLAAGLIGLGSAVFHPESSRIARLASGGRHGLAQSVFQVGGNAGSALGPVLAAFFVAPLGQRSLAWGAVVALIGMVLTFRIGRWVHSRPRRPAGAASTRLATPRHPQIAPRRVTATLAILAALIFSKYFYLASLTSYFTFYLISRFHVSVQSAQVYLFVFLAAVAVGTLLGGAVGDRVGRKPVIWGSILGVLPFSLLLPHVTLAWTAVLAVIIGIILASAFSAIVVYAQELVPGRVGLISGVFFGFAFGMGGLGAAALGQLADRIGIEAVYRLCAFLPAIGLLAAFLPDLDRPQAGA